MLTLFVWKLFTIMLFINEVGGQAVLGRQSAYATPWLTERHGYDPTLFVPSLNHLKPP